MNYILVFDQGTTSSRAIVFDRRGAMHSVAQQEFTQYFPYPGWVEHDPIEIWESQIAVARQAMNNANLSAKDICAIGITNQRETTVIWDRTTGHPIHRAIVWQDRRTADLCNKLELQGHAPLIAKQTGLVLDPYFSASKIRWILENVPGAGEKAERGDLAFGTVDSWLVYKLTSGRLHITDATNASRTMLYNIHTGAWESDLLDLFEIPASLMPDVKSSCEVYGDCAPDILDGAIPIAGIAGDQQAALFGQLCTSPGMVKTTYGTGCFMLMATGRQAVASKSRLLTTVALKINKETRYALEGSLFTGGAAVQWLRDGLGLIESVEQVEDLARTVEDNGGVYLVPAFTGLGAPHWDPYARGSMLGLTRGTNRGHFARAALEAIAYQVADLLVSMEADSGIKISEMRVDGGASKNDMLMQFQADITGIPALRPQNIETTAQGAAFLAGLGIGFWKDENEVAQLWQPERKFSPVMEIEKVQRYRSEWLKALERARNWARPD